MLYFGSVKAVTITALLLCSSLYFSCNHAKKQKTTIGNAHKLAAYQQVESDTSSIILTDTLYNVGKDSISIKKIKCYLKPNSITQLPFGFKVTKQNFAKTRELFADLESGRGDQVNGGPLNKKPKRETKNYVLPHIKKINYIPLPGDTDRCVDGTTFNSLLKFNKYQYRLPDISNYQCYYFTQFNNSPYFSSRVNSNCGFGLIEDFYVGYLILYNQTTQEAQVIKIYRDTFQDGIDYHTVFYIDQNKRIELNRFSAPSDDDGDDPGHPDHDDTLLINIDKAGVISIKKSTHK